MTVGERIKKCRTDRDLSLEDVSKVVGVSRQTLCRYETGVIKDIPDEKIQKLASFFEVNPSFIKGWDDLVWNPVSGYIGVDVLSVYYESGYQVVCKFDRAKMSFGDLADNGKQPIELYCVIDTQLEVAVDFSGDELREYSADMESFTAEFNRRIKEAPIPEDEVSAKKKAVHDFVDGLTDQECERLLVALSALFPSKQ